MFDPVFKQYHKWEQVKQQDRNSYWKRLKEAYSDYNALVNGTEYNDGINGFYYYMQANFGIQIQLVDGKFGAGYNIVDEGKYLLFVMKYT